MARSVFVRWQLALYSCLFSLTFLLNPTSVRGENWPQWRGPQGDGHSTEKGIPTQWSNESLTFKTALPGLGHSSPVIWNDKIFLTSALEKGKQRVVLCLDRNTGKKLWEQVAWTGEPEPVHAMTGWAAATCTTDGERVYAFFGKGGLHCYTVDGKHVWSLDLGPFVGPWGTAGSPVLYGDTLIQNCDADENPFLLAVNKKTGKEVWKTKRDTIRGWSTPIFVKVGDHTEMVMNGDRGTTAYNPTTGEELWFCKGFNGRGSPTVVPGKDLVYTINGKPGDIYSIKPGGEGDVTKTHMAWHTPRRGGRDLPSPILIDNYLMVVNMKGIGTCYDAQSGKQLWTARIGGNHGASPVAVDGKAYFHNEEGKTIIVEPGNELKIIAENKIGSGGSEIFRGSLAISDGQIFIRSDQNLYCVGKRKTANSE